MKFYLAITIIKIVFRKVYRENEGGTAIRANTSKIQLHSLMKYNCFHNFVCNSNLLKNETEPILSS